MKQEEYYLALYENCLESVIIYGNDGKIISANQAAEEETGYFEEILDLEIIKIYPVLHSVMEEESIFHQGVRKRSLETVAYRKNQTCYPVKIRLIYLEDNRNVCFALNMSERNEALRSHQQAIEALEEANKMKTEFMANLTHELRTPINGIYGMTKTLKQKALDTEMSDAVQMILRCCKNMTKIINDLLDFSKMDAGKLSIEMQEFNFSVFLDNFIKLNINRIYEKGLKLILDVSPMIPEFLIGDELRIEQILGNLVSNAIKFTSRGHIGLEIEHSYLSDSEIELYFMVIDTGIGISGEDKDKLFCSFSQVDGSITRKYGGTGLGLAICKQLVELMEGSIHVSSEIGKGSTFSFTIRIKASDRKESSQQPRFSGRFVYDSAPQKSQIVYAKTEEEEIKYTYLPLEEYYMEDTLDEKLKKAEELLEKTIICIELGNWEKAESFAALIKNLLPEEEEELVRTAFSMLLAIRREDEKKAFDYGEYLGELLSER